MLFPFSISYTKPLKSVITNNNRQEVLDYIQRTISEKKADNIVVAGNRVSYKGSRSNWKHSLFNGVDSGVFYLISSDGNSQLRYEYHVYRLIRETGIISAGFGIIGQVINHIWWISIIYFLFLCGGNWLIHATRQEDLVARLAKGIDNLLGVHDKLIDKERKDDSEKLKSWF